MFGGPYRQAVCLDDSYLLAASLYMHLNPVKAGISREPCDYRWSTARLYVDDEAPESFVDPDFILNLLNDDISESKGQYSLLVKQGSDIETGEVLEQEDVIDRLRTKVAAVFPSIFQYVERKRKIAEMTKMDLLGFDEIERKIEEVRIDTSTKPESRKAKKFLIEQLRSRGFKQKEIAERLGISRKTVYNLSKLP